MTREKSAREQLHGFPDNLEEALKWKPDAMDCDAILLCGMGGSAISGAIVADLYTERSRIPLVTVNDFCIPSWANERTTAIISSYSGNTLETLCMYEAARKAGCRIVAMTSGGRLKEICEKDGVPVRTLPDDMQPRHSIGYMIGYTMRLLESYGCVCCTDRMDEVVGSLKEFRDRLESAEGRERIDGIVERLCGHVPVIVTDRRMQSVAFRWKTQINENSKFVAFCESSSEFDYGKYSKQSGNLAVVALGPSDVPDGPRLIKIDEGREDLAENALCLLMVGDYVSVRMAEKRGVDPESVKPVKRMKEKLTGKPEAVHPSLGRLRRYQFKKRMRPPANRRGRLLKAF